MHQLRKSGDPAKRDRVNALLASGEAAWCPPVRLECGAASPTTSSERRSAAMRPCFPSYEISSEVWDRSNQLADRGAVGGLTVPLTDLLIFACARLNGLDVAHDDSHFDELAKLEA